MTFLHQSGDIILERYVILNKLGQGGTAITYAAKDLQTEEQVAIKVLSLQKLDDWKKIELFDREAKILQQLNHPAIPKYLDYFQIETEDDNLFYIVQQLALGKSLATLTEEGWQPDEETVKQIAEQVLDILTYLQQLVPPVIHRDIKPQNIIRSDRGEIFLVDFGAVQDTYHLTVMGSTVVGTYGYMAPEQFRGQAFLSTDLYGLGTTLLFLLTGQSPSELPQRKLKIDFRNSVKISSKFADWIDRLLEPDRDLRFNNAEFALDVLQGKKALSNFVRQKRPNYTSVSLTKTEDKLVINIPPAIFYEKCDRLPLFFTVAWYIAIVFLIFGVSASISYPIVNAWFLIYAVCLVAEIFVVDSYVIIFQMIQAFWLLISLVFFGIAVIIFKISSSIIISYLLLFIDRFWNAKKTILGITSLMRNILFTTNVQIVDRQIKVTRKFFNINLVDIDSKRKDTSILKVENYSSISVLFNTEYQKSKEYQFGGLLTKEEKSWLFEEIDRWLKNK
ncbi:MAG: serine/threonine protein kinase [Xenococcaceae cyanobacterium]